MGSTTDRWCDGCGTPVESEPGKFAQIGLVKHGPDGIGTVVQATFCLRCAEAIQSAFVAIIETCATHEAGALANPDRIRTIRIEVVRQSPDELREKSREGVTP